MLPAFVTFGCFNVSTRGVCHLAQIFFHMFSWPDPEREGRLCKYFNSLFAKCSAQIACFLYCSYGEHSTLIIFRHFYILLFGLHCSVTPIVSACDIIRQGNLSTPWSCHTDVDLSPKGGAVARNTPFPATFGPVLVKPLMRKISSGGSPRPPFP